MTINQLIERLVESGDEKWRDTAEVKVLDENGRIIDDNIDVFNVKDGNNSIDIYIDLPPY